jgi:hypothetical protein
MIMAAPGWSGMPFDTVSVTVDATIFRYVALGPPLAIATNW